MNFVSLVANNICAVSSLKGVKNCVKSMEKLSVCDSLN